MFNRIVLWFIVCVSVATAPLISQDITSVQPSTATRLETLLSEIEQHNGETAEMTVKLSRFQDTLLAHLESQPDLTAYVEEVEAIEPLIEKFYRYSDYVYTKTLAESGNSLIEPQVVYLDEDASYGRLTYLNTFKTGRHLTENERERYFAEEFDWYTRDAVEVPFTLDEQSLEELSPDTLYIFVMFPDGKIRIAKDRVDAEYHVRNEHQETRAFSHPNHTILASDPHQGVISAGALLFYESDGKRLYFISNQSGHFRPTPWSLNTVRNRLRELQIRPDPIVQLSDTDFGSLAVRKFPRVKIPVEMTEELAEKLFYNIYSRWLTMHEGSDWEAILTAIAENGAEGVDEEQILALSTYREMSVTQRSAFHLFDIEYASPVIFHKYVKALGRLKDAIKHDEVELQKTYAEKVLRMLHEYDMAAICSDFRPTNDEAFQDFIRHTAASIRNLSAEDDLTANDFHRLKKQLRDISFLFDTLANERIDFHISRATAQMFSKLNTRLQVIHDEHVGEWLRGEADGDTARLPVTEEHRTAINSALAHLKG